MRIKNTATLSLILILLFFLSACDQQTSSNSANASRINFDTNVHNKELENFIIHVNALTTDQLPPEVARGYNISRSKSRAMINVSVREKQTDGELPITASVTVLARNLSNQLKNIKFREIKEEGPLAIYYIAELPVSNEEIIVFDLDVTPAGANKPFLLSYRQQFYTQ